jgi:hypothetical protein
MPKSSIKNNPPPSKPPSSFTNDNYSTSVNSATAPAKPTPSTTSASPITPGAFSPKPPPLELQSTVPDYQIFQAKHPALGLPFFVKKTYDGNEYDVSEYTMSEIIASVYEMMEQTGIEQGILFLDEINCLSENLAPVMLQFL